MMMRLVGDWMFEVEKWGENVEENERRKCIGSRDPCTTPY
jgi:chaperone required for assembly of F1-ATPase